VAVIVWIGDYFYYAWDLPEKLPFLRGFSPRWLTLIPLIFLAEVFRKYHDDLYIFGTHKITHQRGRLSLSYKVPVVKYLDIRSITVIQDIWGRILDFGNIEISTAAQQGPEMVVTGVRAPEDLALLVEDLRNYSRDLEISEVTEQEVAMGDQIVDGE